MADPVFHQLSQLLDLSRRARHAGGRGELEFILVNDSHNITPYRQAVLWLAADGVRALSGVFEIEKNAPYVHWLNRLCNGLDLSDRQVRVINPDTLPADMKSELDEWLPRQMLWLPLLRDTAATAPAEGGVLLARDLPWQNHEMNLLAEWIDTWQSHYFHNIRHHSNWLGFSRATKNSHQSSKQWWRKPAPIIFTLLLAISCIPVRLNVLAPGELVPSNPFVVSAPLDGIVGDFHVKPNEQVKAGTSLFSLDDTTLHSRLDVATQTLATAEAAYRQSAQMAVFDPKAKVQLASLMGKIAEQRAEVSYVRSQLKRTKVTAPADGIALFDDPTEWIGKPVTTGEPIMRVAEVEDKEIEAWLAVADAVPFEQEAPVKFYLSSSPLHPVEGKVRYMAYEAVQRPDGTYAYRVRASLTANSTYRLGLKGTVKIEGEKVRLIYWVLRRPWSVLRQYLGI